MKLFFSNQQQRSFSNLAYTAVGFSVLCMANFAEAKLLECAFCWAMCLIANTSANSGNAAPVDCSVVCRDACL